MVPVCTSSSGTGRTLCMDTSQVPQNIDQECRCNVYVEKNALTTLVHYIGPDYPDCGISFKILKNVSCNTMTYNMENYKEEIIFSKASDSEATASVMIYIGKLIEGTGYSR